MIFDAVLLGRFSATSWEQKAAQLWAFSKIVLLIWKLESQFLNHIGKLKSLIFMFVLIGTNAVL